MYEQVEKAQKNKSRAVANSVAQNKSKMKQRLGVVDNRLESIIQRNIRTGNSVSTESRKLLTSPNGIQPMQHDKTYDTAQVSNHKRSFHQNGEIMQRAVTVKKGVGDNNPFVKYTRNSYAIDTAANFQGGTSAGSSTTPAGNQAKVSGKEFYAGFRIQPKGTGTKWGDWDGLGTKNARSQSVWEKGHMLGKQLGGDGGDPDNLFYQTPESNRVGEWRNFEDNMMNQVKTQPAGANVHWVFGLNE